MAETVRPQSFLRYRGYRHARWAGLGLIAASALYLAHDPVGGRNGGTWVGYGLGTLAAAALAWLCWFGVRKRSYAAAGASLAGWLSAHTYLGAALVVLVPLHSGFQMGWNVHGLAYALVLAAVASGAWGVWLYVRLPRLMTENRRGATFDSLFAQVAELDAQCRGVAQRLPDHYARAVAVSIGETRVGGSLLRQLSGRDPACGTTRALEMIREEAQELPSDRLGDTQRLREMLSRKTVLLERIRSDVRLQALSELWLLLHVPLAVASLAAVLVHVIAVFYYR